MDVWEIAVCSIKEVTLDELLGQIGPDQCAGRGVLVCRWADLLEAHTITHSLGVCTK